MDPSVDGMLTGKGQITHGSKTLNPLEEAPQDEGPHDGVAEDRPAPSTEKGLPRANGEEGHNGTRSKELDHIA